MQNNCFQVRYELDSHQVSAETLAKSLLAISRTVQIIADETHPTEKLNLKIDGTGPGSFLIDLLLEVGPALPLVFENKKPILTIINLLGEIFSIHQFFKGKVPSEENVTIANGQAIVNKGSGTISFSNCIFNTYKDSAEVRDCLAENFETLERDELIKGFELRDNEKKTLVNIPRSDFPAMRIKHEKVEGKEKITTERTTLTASKVILGGNSKRVWEFIYAGRKISAKVTDKGFQTRVKQGEISFSNGDRFEVDLKIKHLYDKSLSIYTHNSYEVARPFVIGYR